MKFFQQLFSIFEILDFRTSYLFHINVDNFIDGSRCDEGSKKYIKIEQSHVKKHAEQI